MVANFLLVEFPDGTTAERATFISSLETLTSWIWIQSSLNGFNELIEFATLECDGVEFKQLC